MAAVKPEIEKLIKLKWRNALRGFLGTGKMSPEFRVYLESDPKAQEALGQVFAVIVPDLNRTTESLRSASERKTQRNRNRASTSRDLVNLIVNSFVRPGR
jgi:hypothetical protein